MGQEISYHHGEIAGTRRNDSRSVGERSNIGVIKMGSARISSEDWKSHGKVFGIFVSMVRTLLESIERGNNLLWSMILKDHVGYSLGKICKEKLIRKLFQWPGET